MEGEQQFVLVRNLTGEPLRVQWDSVWYEQKQPEKVWPEEIGVHFAKVYPPVVQGTGADQQIVARVEVEPAESPLRAAVRATAPPPASDFVYKGVSYPDFPAMKAAIDADAKDHPGQREPAGAARK